MNNKIYYKDDFVLPPIRTLDIRGHDVLSEKLDFDISLRAGGYTEFVARRRGNNLYNCSISEGAVIVYADRHGLHPGQLNILMTAYLPDANMPDGSRRLTRELESAIEIVDYPVTLELSASELAAVLPVIKGDPGSVPESEMRRIDEAVVSAVSAVNAAKAAAEKADESAEKFREAEEARVEAEESRVEAEKLRCQSENARKTDEELRREAEVERVKAEADRVRAEEERARKLMAVVWDGMSVKAIAEGKAGDTVLIRDGEGDVVREEWVVGRNSAEGAGEALMTWNGVTLRRYRRLASPINGRNWSVMPTAFATEDDLRSALRDMGVELDGIRSGLAELSSREWLSGEGIDLSAVREGDFVALQDISGHIEGRERFLTKSLAEGTVRAVSYGGGCWSDWLQTAGMPSAMRTPHVLAEKGEVETLRSEMGKLAEVGTGHVARVAARVRLESAPAQSTEMGGDDVDCVVVWDEGSGSLVLAVARMRGLVGAADWERGVWFPREDDEVSQEFWTFGVNGPELDLTAFDFFNIWSDAEKWGIAEDEGRRRTPWHDGLYVVTSGGGLMVWNGTGLSEIGGGSACECGTRLDSLSERVDGIEGRATALESSVSGVEGRVSEVESSVQSLEVKVDGLSGLDPDVLAGIVDALAGAEFQTRKEARQMVDDIFGGVTPDPGDEDESYGPGISNEEAEQIVDDIFG